MTPTESQSLAAVVAGYNHDIPHRGEVFHVQTELIRPNGQIKIVTEVYRQGQIVASHRIPWEVVGDPEDQHEELALQVRVQHKAAIKCLLVDKLDQLPAILAKRQAARQLNPDVPPGRTLWKPKLSRVAPHRSGSQELGLRRVLIRFVRAVGNTPPEALDTLGHRLRSIAAAIAVLLNHEGGRRLRQDDLAELMMTRSETMRFLSQDPILEQGRRLWESFASLARLFAAINRRHSLCTHDREAMTRVLATWGDLDRLDQAPDTISLGLLKSCWGRDQVMDDLLDDPRRLTIARLLPEVLRITEELERAPRSESDDRPLDDG